MHMIKTEHSDWLITLIWIFIEFKKEKSKSYEACLKIIHCNCISRSTVRIRLLASRCLFGRYSNIHFCLSLMVNFGVVFFILFVWVVNFAFAAVAFIRIYRFFFVRKFNNTTPYEQRLFKTRQRARKRTGLGGARIISFTRRRSKSSL